MIMKKIIISLLCSLIIVLTPIISAVEYDCIKQDFEEKINEVSLIKLLENIKIDEIKNVKTTALIWNLFVFLLNIFLNLILTVFNVFGSFIKIIFSIVINLLASLIKNILKIASKFGTTIDVIATIIKGLFSVLVNVIIGLIGIIKDVIIEILTPQMI